jgi:calcineurin-like phosphoesterase family protein
VRIDLLRNAIAHARAARRGAGLALALAVLILAPFGHGCATTVPPPQELPQATADLRLRLEKYEKDTQPLRDSTVKKIPDGKAPEEQAKVLERRRTMLATEIVALRARAKPGDLFTATGTEYIRGQMTAAFAGPGADTIRDALEEQNDPALYKTPSARVDLNHVLSIPTVPAVLMDDLPALPDPVEYRFAGRTLVLSDKESGVVLDYIPGAFSEVPPKAPPERTAAATAPKTFDYLPMPGKARSVRFAVLGDTGTGDENQAKVAETLWNYYAQGNRFKFILLLGDNLYAALESARDYEREFTTPYKKFLDARIQFHATLGNHDLEAQDAFKPFGMGGHPYYSFKEGNARFVALNSNEPTDVQQLAWLDQQFSGWDGWRICFFHHPLYSSGVHAGESEQIRRVLEGPLVKNQVNAVFSGHEHFYERSKPQAGIQYFIDGSSARLRVGNLHARSFTAYGYDREQSVMVVEIAGDELFFQTLGVSGRTIDCGVVHRTPKSGAASDKDPKTQAWLRKCDAAAAWARRPPAGEKS